MFVGAPLFAREFEHGTWRLVATQTVTRTRWLAVKLAVVGAGVAGAGVRIATEESVRPHYRAPLTRITDPGGSAAAVPSTDWTVADGWGLTDGEKSALPHQLYGNGKAPDDVVENYLATHGISAWPRCCWPRPSGWSAAAPARWPDDPAYCFERSCEPVTTAPGVRSARGSARPAASAAFPRARPGASPGTV